MSVSRRFILVAVLVLVIGIVIAELGARLIPAQWEPRISWRVGFVVLFVAVVAGLLSIFKDLTDIVKRERGRGVQPATLREHLAAHLTSQITREQNRKRYIPDVFVEVAVVKDRARFFAHPVLFLKKVVDAMRRLDFSALNRILLRLSQEAICLEVSDGFESANKLEGVENECSFLLDVLRNARNALAAFSDPYSAPARESIPAEKRYIYDEIKYSLGWMANSLERKIDSSADDLRTIRSRVLFLIGRAGQGKTNFVCDFAVNVLLGRSLPCLFLTGRDFNQVDSHDLSNYLATRVVGDLWGGNLPDMLVDLDRLGAAAQAPVSVIIDGISDHSDIRGFSQGLESLIERILRDSSCVRFVLTCRSEYFDQRFANFRECSFADKICFVENFERHMTGTHKEHLVAAYFRFFNLRCPFLSQRAREVLEGDTLLLRMFCEAYGDPAAQEEVVLPEVPDIYRDEIFRIYLRKKLEGAAEYADGHPRLHVGLDIGYKRLLSRIVEVMIERRQFADIPIVDLGDEHQATLADMLGEDIMVRKDLVEGRGVLDESSEVVSFTFDEFRDFLLADHLVTSTFRQDPEGFEEIVGSLCAPESPVAEGISKFIFYASKRPENRALFTVIAQTSWYREVFLECVFSVQEDLISQDDLREIESRFHDSPRNSSRIIRSLIGRWRTDIYPVLNIRLLFVILDTLDVSGYDRLVRPALKGDDLLYSYHDRPRPMDQLVDQIRQILIASTPASRPCSENLAELLVYLFDIRGRDRSFGAFTCFCDFAESHPDVAVSLLVGHTTIGNSRIAARVWDASAPLASRGTLSQKMVEEACRQLPELALSDAGERHRLARAVARFLSVCNSSGRVQLPDGITRLVDEFASVSSWRAGYDDHTN